MLRTFNTHDVRPARELSGRLWRFTPLDDADGVRASESSMRPVPSCWQTYPGFEQYAGRARYETTFETTDEGNVRLEFKGVSHFASVRVDGETVAEHYGSYTPFDAVVRGLKPGEHTLSVDVDGSFSDQYALDVPNDYMSYGGISRGVALEQVGDLFVERVHVTPVRPLVVDGGADGETGGWVARVRVRVRNLADEPRPVTVGVRLLDVPEGEAAQTFAAVAQPGSTVCVDEELTFPHALTWRPEEPNLHRVAVTLFDGDAQSGAVAREPIDDLIDRVGFRTVEVRGNRILVNGRAPRIKGFCRHEDHPDYGCAIPFGIMNRDLMLIRDMGGNAVRTSHYPNDELFLDLADELGILIWEEGHARGLSEEQMRHPRFEEQSEQTIAEMIDAHANHPSIFIWGILNECASETEYGRTCYEAQYALIRSLDASRPVSSATCKFHRDICLDLPDVVSWNMYPYWYERRTATDMVSETHAWSAEHGGEGKPFLVTETGAGAIYGFRDPGRDIWSEEYQAYALREQLSQILAFEPCQGVFIWQFCDCKVSRDWFKMRPRSRNNKGIVDEYRRPKLAYDAVKAVFGSYDGYLDA
ncbi:glycoside hydrolase family 2 protein [Bifidobacterium avesanii]|uniref:Beta-glucuronidase n=1 Tax=Bifidobacterium avesanii TaxID=1798157 RepID=A0A7K3TFM2_9BIFI|nr:glycoside hydrolase family 2 TIM barrel-domain containing protein [Bifidobacterium avesanii]KAB8294453.1 Beta-glucuronidase [Bifidobacterium avesanii]NEG77716.1 hypothetical protein [Bifidobacterium avesanii]